MVTILLLISFIIFIFNGKIDNLGIPPVLSIFTAIILLSTSLFLLTIRYKRSGELTTGLVFKGVMSIILIIAFIFWLGVIYAKPTRPY
jgi:hypothetical protein